MTKYRIVKRWYSAESALYVVEVRFLWLFWNRERAFCTMWEAEDCIIGLKADALKPKPEVVYQE